MIPPFPHPFGKYLLMRRLALGGMAEIFLAKSLGAEGFQRDVVIKRILPSYSEDEAFVAMFIDEARIAARLHHPNIVQIFDFDKAEDSYYIAMEFVDGRDLRKVLDRGLRTGKRLTPLRAMHVVADIAAGLRHAHIARGDDGKPLNVVHRDVSPHNIVMAFGGESKILDFGIAKAAARSTKTRVGTVKGKCSYMSPEQARGRHLDGRSDMFALCAIGWEILTGRKLFDGDTDFEILNNVLTHEIPVPSSLNPAVTPDLDAILMKGMSRDRDARYPDMAAFEKELRNYEFRHAKGLDEVAIAPYLQDLFAEEMPVHDDNPHDDSGLQVSASDHGTLMLTEESSRPMLQQVKAGAQPEGKTPVAVSPAAVITPSSSSSGEMPTTVPVGALRKELEDYLADSSSGSLTPSAGTLLPQPVVQVASGATGGQSSEATPVKGVAAGAVVPALAQRKNATLPLPASEVETALAKFSSVPRKPELPVAKKVDASVPDTTSTVSGKTVVPGSRRRLAIVGLVLVGLSALVFILWQLLGPSGGSPGPDAALTVSQPIELPLAGAAASPPREDVQPIVTPPASASKEAPAPALVASVGSPAPEAPEPVASKTAARVSLSVRVDPRNARVMVDGKTIATPGGMGRVNDVFKIGDDVEIVTFAAGHKAHRQKVRLTSASQLVSVVMEDAGDKTQPVQPRETGFVTINARPWADVFWKGNKVGTTPLRSYEVPVGNQVFVLTNQTSTKELPVTVQKGKTTSHIVDVR